MRSIRWHRFLKLEKIFIAGALVSAALNIGLILHVRHSSLFLPGSHISVVENGATVVLRKENRAGNSFAIEVYRNNDIVSNAIQIYDWESSTLRDLNEYFMDYSTAHNISLSDLTFVDIGANIGWFSLNMAALGVKVLAFEPMKGNIELFRNSLQMSQNIKSGVSGRITLYEHGLGVKEETCFLYSDNFNFGDGHVKCVDNEADLNMDEDYSIRGRVPLKRLDDVIVNSKEMHVVAVKMDTEGFEAHVFEGGKKFFMEGGVDGIETEFVPENIVKKGGDPREFMIQMSKAGYAVKKPSEYGNDGYMSTSEMLNMDNFGSNILTLHSPSQQDITNTTNNANAVNTWDNRDYYNGMYNNTETDKYYLDKNSSTGYVTQYNELKKFVIGIYPENDIVSSAIKDYWNSWETDTVKKLNDYFQDYSKQHGIPLSDLTFIDIGANIGWLSLNMAALGVKVLAFEPMEENIRLFKKSLDKTVNIESGVSGRITLYEYGLGVKEETCFLFSDDTNFGDGHVKCVEKEADLSMQANYTVRGRVPIKRLDDVLDVEEMRIAAINMDTEGYEGNILEGGTKVLLGGSINAIITEFKPEWVTEKGGDPVEFMNKMANAGYRVKKDWGYMTPSDMMNLTNFGDKDVTFDSPKLIAKFMGNE